ncbi:MAG: histidine ammonia-lyase [Deltaproteobacteria bacterium]|jgi:histidine ammonia-lyase|nr:histidine ammonia-lyase [Deltaproteobacteria bacterium]
MAIKIDGKGFTLDEIRRFISGETVEPSRGTISRIKKVREFVEGKLSSEKPYYGINTGFGNMASCHISHEDLEKLQENLIISHAVGVGDPLRTDIAKLIMLLRANVLAVGYSGIRLETFKLLLDMINRDLIPVIPEKGSVGASGDLAPLAHLALTLIGRGEVYYKGLIMPAAEALKTERLEPIKLQAKEGIALINGTQAIAAIGCMAHIKMENLIKVADIVGALSVEGDLASARPFDERIHKLRPHPGQMATADNMRILLSDSEIIADHRDCGRVQDPYSFRCIPQVHGAVKDAAKYSRDIVLRETGSCTDNPLLFAKDDEILSGGNFHGEPLAFAMDMLAIAAAELGSISERRVAVLTTPIAGEIPTKSLVPNPGLSSGLMTPHVTMSALVSENKVLAHPSSVDSIPTFGGQEDHVSMGTIGARKALQIIENVEIILAIELFAACQAIDLQNKHGKPGLGTSAVFELVRKVVDKIDEDREYRLDINRCIEMVRGGEVVKAAESVCSEMKI